MLTAGIWTGRGSGPLSHAVTAARAIFPGNIANANVGEGFLIMEVSAVLAGAARSFGRAIG